MNVTETKKQGCEFCLESSIVHFGNFDCDIGTINGKNTMAVGYCSFDYKKSDSDSFEINYCPMCGRRL